MADRLGMLVQAYADERINADELRELEGVLLESAEARERFLREINVHAALDDWALAALDEENETRTSFVGPTTASGFRHRRAWFLSAGIALSLIVAIGAFVFWPQPTDAPPVATVTGVSGPIQWTGNGGLVRDDLVVGADLPAGTLEGISPQSWLEMEFGDGTKVSVVGNTRLTYSEADRKELRLGNGQLFADVRPQPAGCSLLVTTPTATLEVVGTEFRVEADAYSTAMAVSEGRVRVVRRSDGRVVDVDAGRRVVVAADHDLQAQPEPGTSDAWRSRIELGPAHMLGRWRAPSGDASACLSSVPYTTDEKLLIHAIGLGVSRCDGDTIVLGSGSRIRWRGSLDSAHAVYFGMTVRTRNGDFAGRFQTVLPKDRFRSGEPFDVVIDIEDLELDPMLAHVRDRLPSDPSNLVVESVWCHTLGDPVGLSITNVGLLPEASEGTQRVNP